MEFSFYKVSRLCELGFRYRHPDCKNILGTKFSVLKELIKFVLLVKHIKVRPIRNESPCFESR